MTTETNMNDLDNRYTGKGVGGTGLGLGIAGTALGLLNGGLGLLNGGGFGPRPAPGPGPAPYVTREEFAMANDLAAKDASIADLKAEMKDEKKMVEVWIKRDWSSHKYSHNKSKKTPNIRKPNMNIPNENTSNYITSDAFNYQDLELIRKTIRMFGFTNILLDRKCEPICGKKYRMSCQERSEILQTELKENGIGEYRIIPIDISFQDTVEKNGIESVVMCL